jgi:tRNA nucleotidyltransferase (CCA-adding enzyme)
MQTLVHQIAEEIASQNGSSWYAGGYVRDRLSGRTPVDLDIEVHALPLEKLEKILRRHGSVSAVGRSFGILKFHSEDGDYDFSLPRRENREGRGHRGFVVDLDPSITFEEACSRRDFTVNAMLENVLSGEVLDFFGGQKDLAGRVLRHVGPAFEEDPLRAYRLMQQSARFEMAPAPETLALCQRMDLSELAPERVFVEWSRLLLEAQRPSIGLETARKAGILAHHPELAALIGCLQDPSWHPEGDVWTHTLLVVDEAAGLRSGQRGEDLILMFGALCHDFGKPDTTFEKDGRIVSPGHAEKGVAPALRFMERMTQDTALLEGVEQVVRYHLRPAELYRVRDEVGHGAIRRLALKVKISDLVRWARADHFGRRTDDALERDFPAGEWLMSRAEDLDVHEAAPKPILLGRHLLDQGWTPGPDMGERLKQAYEAQLDDAFQDLDGALRWLEESSG